MSVFLDDFERANGALGNGWTVTAGSPLISGGTVFATANWAAVQGSLPDNNYLDVTVKIARGDFSGHRSGPVVCTDTGSYVGFALTIDGTAAPYTLAIRDGGRYTGNIIASYSLNEALPPYYTLRLVWDQGNLSGYYEGRLLIETTSGLYSNQHCGGFTGYYQASAILDFKLAYGGALSLTADPNVIGNYGECTEIALTGSGTAWTPGTPGSPTFTVDHGTISAQEVLTATTATITYCPGNYLGSATITDPSTGESVGIVVTSDPNVLPPGSVCDFDDDFVDTANATVRADTRGLPTLESVIVPAAEGWGNVYLQEAIADLWYAHFRPEDMPEGQHSGQGKLDNLLMWISGGYLPTMATPQPPPQTTLKEDTEELLAQLSDIRTQNDWTLGSVITELAGPGAPQHTDILAAIAGISGGSNQDVLDRLDEIQGAGGYSLSSLTLILDLIRTIHNYNLGDVVDRLDARPTNLALAAAVASIEGAIAGLALEVGAVGAAVTAAAAETTSDLASDLASALALATGVADILLQLAQLKELLGAGAKPVRVPPIWPGIDNVTLGPIIALETTTLVPGPMHGVSVHISGCEPGTRYFDYDSIRSWSHVGALAFGNERGELEPFQVLGPAAAFYCAKTMAVADSCRLYRSRNVRGTIQSWMVNEG